MLESTTEICQNPMHDFSGPKFPLIDVNIINDDTGNKDLTIRCSLCNFSYFFLKTLFFEFLLLFLFFLSTLALGLDLGADLDLRLVFDLSIFVNVL
jgi:hypothetical protein